MKQFILKILLFSSFCFIVYSVIIIILGNNKVQIKNMNFAYREPGRIKLRIDDLKNIDSLDILFLGSSKTFMGFDTRIFEKHNLKSFNFGSLAQTPIQTKYLYKKYATDLKVKLIVFEVSPTILSNDGSESTTDLINSENIDLETIKICLKYKNAIVWNTLYYRLLQQTIGIKLKQPEAGGYIKGSGYSPSFELNKNPNEQYKLDSILCDQKQLQAVKELIKIWTDQKIQFLLVQAPITKRYYNSNLSNKSFDSEMSSLGNYYNFNTLISLNDSIDFVDCHHLNQNGVDKFNEALLNKIFLNKTTN